MHNRTDVNELRWMGLTASVTPDLDLTYDAAGNMTNKFRGRGTKYEYDAWYRLVRVKDGSDDIVAEFKYNALGHRISARYNEVAPRLELSLNWAYNERWQMVAMYEDNAVPGEPVEQWWYHTAGASGMGGSCLAILMALYHQYHFRPFLPLLLPYLDSRFNEHGVPTISQLDMNQE